MFGVAKRFGGWQKPSFEINLCMFHHFRVTLERTTTKKHLNTKRPSCSFRRGNLVAWLCYIIWRLYILLGSIAFVLDFLEVTLKVTLSSKNRVFWATCLGCSCDTWSRKEQLGETKWFQVFLQSASFSSMWVAFRSSFLWYAFGFVLGRWCHCDVGVKVNPSIRFSQEMLRKLIVPLSSLILEPHQPWSSNIQATWRVKETNSTIHHLSFMCKTHFATPNSKY